MTTQTVPEVPIEQVAPASGRPLRGPSRHYWLGTSRAVVAIHVLSLIVGLIVLLHENAHLWFFGDDWDFLVDRGLHHPVFSLWQPHNEHWSTLPILWYRLLFTLFGLHYFPYILSAIVAHLVLAHLIWRTCLREGVDPWISTTFAVLFVFLGSGAENLTWPFQITFISSLVFGFLALEVARRPKSIAVDVAISLLLLCALMCSTVGDSMLLAVGVFLVVTRGWRSGFRPLYVPFACYALWYGLIGHTAVTSDHVGLTTLLNAPRFVWSGLEAALGSTFGLSAAGAALLVGLLAWTVYDFPRLYRAHPAVLGLGLGAGSFYFLVALGRSEAGATSAASRYVYVTMALLIPLTATLISLIKRPAFDVRIPVIGLLLLVIVANLGALRTFARNQVALVGPIKQQIVTTASLVARGVPSLNPAPVLDTPNLTTNAMRAFVRSGQLNVVPVSSSERHLDEAPMDVLTTSNPLFSRPLNIIGGGRVTINPGSHGCSAVQATGPNPQVAFATPHPGGSIAIEGASRAVISAAVVQENLVDPALSITLKSSGWAFENSALPTGSLVLTLPPGSNTLFCRTPEISP